MFLIPTGTAKIDTICSTVIVEVRNTTTIICEAFGYPPPMITWSKSNEPLSDRVSVSDSVSVPTGYGNVTRVSVNLTITNIFREDRGVYKCFANNSIGSDNCTVTVEGLYAWIYVTSNYINFTFIVIPDIILQLFDVAENQTNAVEFICQAVGEPVPNIVWYFNGFVLDLSNNFKYHTVTTLLPLGETTIISVLIIINAQSSDVGTYTCVTQNIIGTDQSSGVLTVNGK